MAAVMVSLKRCAGLWHVRVTEALDGLRWIYTSTQ